MSYIYCYFYGKDVLYIGSTKNIQQRQRGHKSSLNNNSQLPFYRYLRERNISFVDLDIEILKVDANSKESLHKLEGDCIKLYNPICNMKIPERTSKQYVIDNSDKVKQMYKQYYINNKENVKQ